VSVAETPESGAGRHLSPEDEAEVRNLLRSLSRHSAPERFGPHVEGRIRRRSRGRFFDSRWQVTGRPTYLGAAIILVILAALFLLSQVSYELRDARTGLSGEELRRTMPTPPEPVPDP
jgi:hypothetical protein